MQAGDLVATGRVRYTLVRRINTTCTLSHENLIRRLVYFYCILRHRCSLGEGRERSRSTPGGRSDAAAEVRGTGGQLGGMQEKQE